VVLLLKLTDLHLIFN